MGYLVYNIPFFLLVAALLGFVIGWLLRGNRFQSELQDLDARWRSKLGEVENERDRFAGEVSQANEARAKYEASATEAKRLAETHESSLAQLRREHQTKLSALGDAEKRAGSLESQLSGRDKELAQAKASLAERQGAGSDGQRLGKELAAATGRAEILEQDLKAAKEANNACKREVERLEARIADLQQADTGNSGAALGLLGSTGSSTGESASGSTAGGGSDGALTGSGGTTGGSSATGSSSSAGGGTTGSVGSAGGRSGSSAPLGLVGGRDAENTGGGGTSGDRNQPGYRQAAASPSYLAESGGQGFKGSASAGSSDSDQEDEGTRPEALTQARGGVADDLKKISGVGPKLEKTLNSLGIFHFAQIATFTPENVAWVDRHLRFKGRIERENWIGQAKTLAAGGET